MVVFDVLGDYCMNFVLGKQILIFLVRVYDDLEFVFCYCIYGILFCYVGNFVVDENYGIYWDFGVGVYKFWLIVDLGSECKVDEIEIIFEFISCIYKYKFEYLLQKEVGSLDVVFGSYLWKVFVDWSMDGVG